MESLAEKVRKSQKTPYQLIAERHGVTTYYVGLIANGHRTPKWGKSLMILEDLRKIVAE